MEKSPAPPIHIVMDSYSSKTELAYNGSREDLEPYVPSKNRPQGSNTSSFGALAHLLKASLGSGVLAMPLAFRNAGLAVGTIGTIIVGFICAHALHILVKTSQQLCVEAKRPALGYAETCDMVFQYGPKSIRKFAPIAREVADWALAITHLGACCVYVVVVAESFKQVSNVYGGPDWPVEIFCALTLVPLVPLCQITKLKYLVPFSAIANFVWLGSICISMYYCLTNVPQLSERDLYTSVSGLPLFISTSLFAMEGVGVVMPVENEMIKPQQFLGCPGVLNIAMTVVVTLYGFVGFSGYLKYGDEARGSLTLNLPQEEILAQIAKILVALVLMLSYALVYYVPVDVVWRRIKNRVSPNTQGVSMSILRLTGVLLTVGLACAVPRLELFMELVGAICLSTLGLFLPAVVETAWLWNRSLGPCKWVLWKNTIIALFSIVALISGCVYSIKAIVDKL